MENTLAQLFGTGGDVEWLRWQRRLQRGEDLGINTLGKEKAVWFGGFGAEICSAAVVMGTGGGTADLELWVSHPFPRDFVHMDICPCLK